MGFIYKERQREAVVEENTVLLCVLPRCSGEDARVYVKTSISILVMHCGHKYLQIHPTDGPVWRVSLALDQIFFSVLGRYCVLAAVNEVEFAILE